MKTTYQPNFARLICFATIPLALFACSDSSTSDPKTIVKSDLNPPANLVSVTESQSMTLQWQITNTEDDIRGYNVYVIEGSIADLTAKHLSQGIYKGLDLSTQQVRRCKDTAGLFSAFGFNADADQAKEDCDEEVTVASAGEDKNATTSTASDGGSALADDKAAPSFVACQSSDKKELGSKDLSVDITRAIDVNGTPVSSDRAKRADLTLLCKVPATAKLSNGKTGFTNGKKYVAFVVAVKGDDADEVSYTSNFVEDIPAKYGEIVVDTTPGLKAGQYLSFDIEVSAATESPVAFDAATPEACKGDSVTTVCRIGGTFEYQPDPLSDTKPKFAVMADSQGGSERLFVAGDEANKVYLAPARPRNDFGPSDTISGIYEPGDRVMPTGGGSYQPDVNFEVLPGSLFYVAVQTTGGQYNYGKLYFQKIATTAGTGSVKAGEGVKTFTAIFAMQPAVGETFAERVAGIPMLPEGVRKAFRSFGR